MKLIVSDFDLTFYDSNYDENIKLINEFVSRGNIFVIATGRSFKLLKRDIEKKNISFKYLICSDGSVILDDKFNVLKRIVFEKNLIDKIIALLKNDDNLQKIEIDEDNNSISGVYAVFNNMEYARKKLTYIMNNYNVSGYVSSHGINIINKNVSKILGIEYIKNILKIDDSKIYTIGDNVNDLEMIDKYNGYIIGDSVNDFKEFINKIASI